MTPPQLYISGHPNYCPHAGGSEGLCSFTVSFLLPVTVGLSEARQKNSMWPEGRGLAFTWHLLPASVPMQATDNYSDFVEERSAGVIVVLAGRRERRTALSLSLTTELLTNMPAYAHIYTHSLI